MHCIHGMTYYIFLKSLRSLEEFRKNPRVKIHPKAPSTNFHGLGKFKNPNFNSEIIFLAFGPAILAARSASGLAGLPVAKFPAGQNHPGQPIQPTCRSRLHGKYVFLFRSRLPESAASPSPLCQPRRRFPARCPAPQMPPSFYSPPSMALKPLTPVINSRPPLPGAPPAPYKRRAPPPEFTAPLPSSLRFTPRSSLPLTERRRLPVLHRHRPASSVLPELR
jgi:hypothetical protein